MDFNRFEVITFDCYGTLIDWETGLLSTLRPLLERHGVYPGDAVALTMYGQLEAEAEAGPYRAYREILREVVRGYGERLGFTPTEEEMDRLPNSLPDWPPFPDTAEALKRLKGRYRLGVISNVDDDLFSKTSQRLGVEFDAVVTAQQARSYKPSLNNFRMMLERVGLPKEKVLHAAQSIYHDVLPARDLGITVAWVNRHAGREGGDATLPAQGQPDLEVPDLKTLAHLACGEESER